MREIKYKVFIKHLQWMLKIESIDFIGKMVEVDLTSGEGDTSWYTFEEVELVQYTGLKDKNGKEIYEGDIVKYSKHIYTDCSQTEIESVSEPITGVFNFFNGCYPTLKLDDERHHLFMVYHLINCENDFEILGNIYENPELLEATA